MFGDLAGVLLLSVSRVVMALYFGGGQKPASWPLVTFRNLTAWFAIV